LSGELSPVPYLIFELTPLTLENKEKIMDEIVRNISKKFKVLEILKEVY